MPARSRPRQRLPGRQAGHAARNQGEPRGLGLSAGGWTGVGGTPGGDDPVSLEAYVAAQATLQDFLGGQLSARHAGSGRPADRPDADRPRSTRPAISASPWPVAERLGVPLARVEAVLAIIHDVRARGNWRAQPRRVPARCSSSTAIATILRWRRCSTISTSSPGAISPALKRVCGVDDEDLDEMVAEIRRLDPKPGLRFGGGPIQPVVPDVYVRQAADGGWLVELNSDVLPRVLVNQSYLAKVSRIGQERTGEGLPHRLPADRELADPQPRAAGAHDPQGRDRDRAPAGCASSSTASSICGR